MGLVSSIISLPTPSGKSILFWSSPFSMSTERENQWHFLPRSSVVAVTNMESTFAAVLTSPKSLSTFCDALSGMEDDT